VTEVPDHLLRRSRERRSALGLGGGDDGTPPPAGAAPGADSPPPASAVVETTPAAATPAVPEPPAPPPPPLPETRTGIPRWMMPVLVMLPFWAIVYVGAFGTTKKAPVVRDIGAATYAGKCASCHGAKGEGGAGPKLAGGEAAKTFPEVGQHIAWVENGSVGVRGKKYGDPNREGGQHGPATGGMPAFKGTLTAAEIEAVVQYERTKL
jgi:mono/diheme cytochrome c family protein